DRLVLAPRLAAGLSGPELAQRTGLPAVTVRQRLVRGLARLRRLLPAGLAGSFAWLTWSGRALAASKRELLRQAIPAAAHAPATAAASLYGSMIVMKAPVFVGLVALLAAASWWWLDGDARSDEERDAAVIERDADVDVAPQPIDEVAAAPIARAPASSTLVVTAPESARIPDSYRKSLSGIRGRLVSRGGAPAARREVTLLEIVPGDFVAVAGAMAEAPRVAIDAVHTDEDGRFTLRGASAGTLHALGVDLGSDRAALRWLDVDVVSAADVDVGDVVLAESVRVEGRVVDDEGDAVADAEVFASPALAFAALAGFEGLDARSSLVRLDGDTPALFELPAFTAGAFARLPIPRARSDADGRFALDGVAVGAVTVVVRHPRFVAHATAPMQLAAHATRDVGAIALEAGETFAGRVVDPEDRPLAAAEVALARRPGVGVFAAARRVACGVDGRFAFEHVDDTQDLVVIARASPFSPWSIVEPAGDDRTIVLERGARLELVVADREGKPIERIRVGVTPRSRFTESFEVFQGESDATSALVAVAPGRFVLDGLLPGYFGLRVVADGFAPHVEGLRIEREAHEARVVLEPASSLAACVVDGRDGSPVEHARVHVLAASPSAPALAHGRTDHAGRVTLAPLAATMRKLALRVEHPAWPTQVVEIDATRGDVAVKLARGGAIEGRLRVGGEPPAGRRLVQLVVSDSAHPAADRYVPYFARSDARGDFRFAHVPAGRHWWVVREDVLAADGLDPALFARLGMLDGLAQGIVDVAVGETAALDIELPPVGDARAASVRGRITRDGRPLAGIAVTAFGATLQAAETDADGRYAIDALTPGRVTLFVRESRPFAEGWSVSETLCTAMLDVAVGESRTQDFVLESNTVRVTVIDASGAPVGDASVEFHPADPALEGFGVSGPTNGRGPLVLQPQKAGRFRVVARSPDAGVATKEIDVRGASELTLTLEPRLTLAATFDVPLELAQSEGQECVLVHGGTGDDKFTLQASVARAPGTPLTRGAFMCRGLGAGRYTLTYHRGNAESVPIAFELGEGGAEGVELRFVGR
ncbi:MAG: carboxypeptidase regulatory-like domain-containing protein, partial [Planctomycetes bacterium]|nr:carboxypeptidase regulatory-like domain-containing protein [Planctomycetota bacterium]